MSSNGDPSPARIGDLDLHAFVDGVLRDDRRNELLAYLASHPLEAERANAFFRQRTLLAELREQLVVEDAPEPAAAFPPVVERRLRGAVRRQRMVRHLRQLAAAVAIILPAALAGWAIYVLEREPQSPTHADAAPPVEQMAPEFPFGASLALADMPSAGTDGTATLAVLAQHLADQSLHVPDLTKLGLKLVGGDAVPGAPTPAARLVYADDAGNRTLVYVAVVASATEQAMAFVPEGNISLHLRRGPLVFAVVGPSDSLRILDVAKMVSEEITQVATAPVVADTATAPTQAMESSSASSALVKSVPVALPSQGTARGGPDAATLPVLPDAGATTLAPVPVGTVPGTQETPKIL
jgi:anti-sigma factor RsiW